MHTLRSTLVQVVAALSVALTIGSAVAVAATNRPSARPDKVETAKPQKVITRYRERVVEQLRSQLNVAPEAKISFSTSKVRLRQGDNVFLAQLREAHYRVKQRGLKTIVGTMEIAVRRGNEIHVENRTPHFLSE